MLVMNKSIVGYLWDMCLCLSILYNVCNANYSIVLLSYRRSGLLTRLRVSFQLC